MKPGKRLKRAKRTYAKSKGKKVYEKRISEGVPQEQAKWLAITERKNILR